MPHNPLTLLLDPGERKRFLRFATVGAMGAVVDLGTFNLLRTFTPIPPVWASVISFVTAVTHNFIWNRYWTYPDSRQKPLWRQGLQFLVLNTIGALIRTPLFAWLRGPAIALVRAWNPGLPISPVRLGENLALGVVMVVILFWNFFSNRLITYGDAPKGGLSQTRTGQPA